MLPSDARGVRVQSAKMIHFLTVHWRSSRWVDPQLEYIRRNTRGNYRVVAAVDPTISAEEHGKFAEVIVTPIRLHSEKLNLLAEAVCRQASDDDWIVFIDNDCFPISDWVPMISDQLRRHEFLAVRRDENVGDRQPHPCFAVTTAGFWKRLKGDWRAGYSWTNLEGRQITDVGGNLLKQLEEADVNWLPLLRSNRTDLHPVFFAVYAGIVYHHGAGSRAPHCRADRERIRAMLPAWRRKILHALGRYGRHVERQKEITGRIGEEIFQQLVRDPQFGRQFMEGRSP